MNSKRKTPKVDNSVVNFLKSIFEYGLENTGMYYSFYRAWVYDRDDPENLQRLKLIIPQVSGNQAYDYWAFPKGVYYGKNHGSQLIPQKGDMVWVEFEGGRPEIPVWSQGHPSRKEMPNDEDLKDKDCTWFVTPQGFKVKFNDTKKSITIETPFGSKLHFNDQGVSVLNGDTANISLGKLNKSTYSAVLGEKLKEVLEDTEKIINGLHTAMVKDIGIFTARGFTNMVKEIPKQTARVAGLSGKIKEILSTINSLE